MRTFYMAMLRITYRDLEDIKPETVLGVFTVKRLAELRIYTFLKENQEKLKKDNAITDYELYVVEYPVHEE